jgi:hypothetical protein
MDYVTWTTNPIIRHNQLSVVFQVPENDVLCRLTLTLDNIKIQLVSSICLLLDAPLFGKSSLPEL